ncbi:DNA pilot protein [Microvirus D_HF32_302]|nr:DNA pilot protein [Microvirus D_HF3_26]WMC01547.1 DNA pilot protein [Microvirus D_HF32_302]
MSLGKLLGKIGGVVKGSTGTSVWGMAAKMGFGLLSKFLGNKVDKSTAIEQYRRKAAIDMSNAKEMASVNDSYQRGLMYDTPTLQKSGQQAAGLSVAALNGGFNGGSTNSNAAQQVPVSATGQAAGSDLLTGIMQLTQSKVLERTADKLTSEKEGQDIENSNKERQYDDETMKSNYRLDWLRNFFEEKKRAYENSLTDDQKKKMEENGATVIAKASDGYMSEERFRYAIGELDLIAQGMDIERAHQEAQRSEYVYKQNLYTIMDNPESIRAIADLPVQTYKEAVEKVRELKNGNDFFERCREFRLAVEQLQVALTQSNIAKNASDIDLNNAKIKEADAHVSEMWATIRQMDAFTHLDTLMKSLNIQDKVADMSFTFKNIMQKYFETGKMNWSALGVCLLGGIAETVKSVAPAVAGGKAKGAKTVNVTNAGNTYYPK